MGDELEQLRQEVASVRARMDELAGAVSQIVSGDFAPDGSGVHPVVLPRVQEVPVGQDTSLLHMAMKPFLRRRLGSRNNAAQVLIELVQRDASGRESSWLSLPPPHLPGLRESDDADTSRLFMALGDTAIRRPLRLLWEGEKAALELSEQANLSRDDLRARLAGLQELGWVEETRHDRFLLTAQGRNVLACASALARSLKRPV